MIGHDGIGRVAAAAMGWFLMFGPLGLGAEPVQGVRLFVGRFTTETTGDSANPFSVNYEDRYILGAAYSRDTASLGSWLAFGWESGVAARFPHQYSMEVWGGCYLRHRGIPLPGSIRGWYDRGAQRRHLGIAQTLLKRRRATLPRSLISGMLSR